MCLEGTLDPQVVKGKIVICERGISPRVQKGHVVKDAGGVGMILTNTETNGEELVADCHLLPAVAIREKDDTRTQSSSFTTTSNWKHIPQTSRRASQARREWTLEDFDNWTNWLLYKGYKYGKLLRHETQKMVVIMELEAPQN
ncbi:hypothetical protein PIB30_087370 [Stylosanthes scabra]|uniref:PA domain-containing protein n=1 Tax=Stylosanthes scabra TaxID=79078 RepID=A0ABU6XVS6_9FABA|nr:hypothetical protein [Stylosanthes scabra]